MTCIKICTFRGEVFFDEICKNTFRGVMFSMRHIFEESYGGRNCRIPQPISKCITYLIFFSWFPVRENWLKRKHIRCFLQIINTFYNRYKNIPFLLYFLAAISASCRKCELWLAVISAQSNFILFI